jgi:hypothetical protein
MARTEQAAYQTKLSPQDYPATLFREFEYDLGQINIHVCAADAALREYTARVLETPAFLRLSVQRWGHRHLNPNELNINRMLDLSYASHIALLLSRMDQLCQRVRRHPGRFSAQDTLAGACISERNQTLQSSRFRDC